MAASRKAGRARRVPSRRGAAAPSKESGTRVCCCGFWGRR